MDVSNMEVLEKVERQPLRERERERERRGFQQLGATAELRH